MFQSTGGGEWLTAGAVFAGFLLAALLIAGFWRTVLSRWVSRTESNLDNLTAEALKNLVVWGIVLAGAYYAIRGLPSIRNDEVYGPLVGKIFGIGWALLAVSVAIRLVGAISYWNIGQAEMHGEERVRDVTTRVVFVRKLFTAVALLLGGLYVLNIAGVDTSPLVAGGALGGLVIGLALQDTLSNVFAGFFLNIDRPAKIGDLIKLETGEEGFVEEVGWRYTKVRLWSNNLLILPNSKFSNSVITNYNLPVAPMSIYVECGVAYDSDLDHVERVALQVAGDIQSSEEGADGEWQPIVRFKEFADSSITFLTILRARDVLAQYRIHHEFIKRLHKAFNREGIEIPFPIRTIVMKKEASTGVSPGQPEMP